MLLLYATCFSSTHAQTKSPPVTPCPNSGYTMVDGPYEQLVKESDAEKRLVMLDNYVAQYKPKPSMLVYIYPLYFQSYNEVRNFPKAMDSVDKLLSLGDLTDVGLRYIALHEWAFAYSNMDSDDTTLAAKALARAREGMEVVRKIEPPQCGDPNAFEAQKKLATIYFQAVAGYAAMKLKDYPAAYDSFRSIVMLGDTARLPASFQKSIQ
jgi:hypothetical protein